MIKITKKQLLEETCDPYYEQVINEHWPWYRRRLSLVEILKRGMKLGIPSESLDYLIWEFDFEGWEKSFPSHYHGPLELPYRKSVNNYLKSAGQS